MRLSIDLRIELADAFAALSEDDSLACIVLTGAGTAFCAGMDMTQFGGDSNHKKRLVETSTAAFHAVGRCPKAVVAAVNGPALAGGFALALICDVRIASRSAHFGYPELPRGIPPSYAAARAVLAPAAARELCLTGRVIDAEEALRLGAVSEVVADADLPARVRALAEEIAALPAPQSSRPSGGSFWTHRARGGRCSRTRSGCSKLPFSTASRFPDRTDIAGHQAPHPANHTRSGSLQTFACQRPRSSLCKQHRDSLRPCQARFFRPEAGLVYKIGH